MTNTVTTVWKENMQFESDNPSGHSVTIDTSPEHGGHNSGLGPKAMMLSSLAGCSGLDVVSLLKKMRAEVDDFKIVVHGELTDELKHVFEVIDIVPKQARKLNELLGISTVATVVTGEKSGFLRKLLLRREML